MKRVLAHLTAAVLLAFTVVPAVRAEVLLSELCDPRNDYLTDRFIEIYNSGPGSVDLTGWQIVAVGNSTEIFTWNLSGSIAPGQALVAGDQTTGVPFTVNFPAEAWSTSNTTWNGKVGDGARLKNGSGVVIDDAVVPGTNFENNTLVRNQNVTTPSLSFNAAQWTATPVDTPTEATPGTHHPVVTSGPTIGAITRVPAAPLPGQTVAVSATVTDGAATITAVTLHWGLTSGNRPNAIAMNHAGGSVYTTAAAIPAQAAGATVYYSVTADNDVPASTVSAEASYSLPYAFSVQQIQGVGASSPEIGKQVITNGVVTGSFGSTFVLQDGLGARTGLWVTGPVAPAVGTAVQVVGQVQEISGNTTLASAQIVATGAGSVPAPQVLDTAVAGSEDWEGVLVQVVNASCTLSDAATPRWEVNNAEGTVAVDDLAVAPNLVLGTRYTITGPLSGQTTAFGIVPRTAADIVLVGDTAAPMVVSATAQGPTTLQVTFTEALSAATAQNAANYTVDGGAALSAVLVGGQPSVVTLTVSFLADGNHSLAINGVTDLYGNAVTGLVLPFSFYGGNIPIGYYDTAEGLLGEPLRLALHNIIDGHSSVSYTGLWTAFYSTDDKPNGKVWDMYSDVPGGTPPYEYTFGTDQGGSAGSEGTGYNREHSWPSSWYGASSPMYTDLFMVYPTDNEVNNRRGSYPFGEVAAPTWTSLNGSRVGACSYPGYSGTVFEPIDEYKGDFARAYFYMSTRYHTEDAGWPGSPMVSGSQLLPWAEAMLLEWNAADPVSTKELDRNEAVYAIQGNRNPFIDRPDFVVRVFQPELSPVPQPALPSDLVLHQNVPNPFNPSTTISFELDRTAQVELQVFDLGGRLVRTLVQGPAAAGRHQQVWLGRDQDGRPVATGVYFYRLRADDEVQTRRMLLMK